MGGPRIVSGHKECPVTGKLFGQTFDSLPLKLISKKKSEEINSRLISIKEYSCESTNYSLYLKHAWNVEHAFNELVDSLLVQGGW